MSCRFHLALDLTPRGSIQIACGGGTLYPVASRRAVDAFVERAANLVACGMRDTCALDVAERAADESTSQPAAPLALGDIGEIVGQTRENVRLIERRALSRCRAEIERARRG